MSDYATVLGARVHLGRQLGKGGEGTVYELAGNAGLVAKIYHKPLSAERAAKIRVMPALGTAGLQDFAAWPKDLLVTEPGHQPIGLTMARVPQSKDVHNLYGPKSRLSEFPRADWRFLVRAATNIARAFAVVHDASVVIGDVNHGSVLVADDATVRLIDCDSFQITTSKHVFPCTVGVETFTPPELQGQSFGDVVQTANHDNFRLAVMVFHLLFMGRHPFAGRFLGHGEMPLGKAIREFRFAYSVTNRAMQMDRPPGTPGLQIAGHRMAGMFELAFARSAVGNGRPSARDWIDSLAELEHSLKRCLQNHGHWFAGHLAQCPWCEMEAMGANSLFPFVMPPGSQIDIESLWKQLLAMPRLDELALAPIPNPAPSPAALAYKRPFALPSWVAMTVGWATFIGLTIAAPAAFFVWAIIGTLAGVGLSKLPKRTDEAGYFGDRVTTTGAALSNAVNDWRARTSGRTFDESRKRFEDAYRALSQIPTTRLRRLDQLKQDQKNLQLSRFLDRFKIEDAKVPNIGPSRKGVLISYGVETADDLTESGLSGIPGFGPKTIERLLDWRSQMAKKFVFDASRAVDPQDIARVEQSIQSERSKLEAAAKVAHAEAMQRHSFAVIARRDGPSALRPLQLAFEQARADLQQVQSR